MSKREQPTGIKKEILYAEVDSFCPRCTHPLYTEKNGSRKRLGEAAHIYPLNPTLEDLVALGNIEPPEEINSPDNFIMLCPTCHSKFDNPRTAAEYQELFGLKKKIIEKRKIKNLYLGYTIEDEIRMIVEHLAECDFGDDSIKLSYDALKIDQKLRDDFDKQKKRTIEHHVLDYFKFIQKLFRNMDSSKSGSFERISTQVRSFYLSAEKETSDQLIIYDGIASWIKSNLSFSVSNESCSIVTSFFIQNCEVFRDASK